jgi:hypothetical protein
MGSDIISHRVAIWLFYIKTNPSAVNYIFCKTFNSLNVLYLLVRYCRYFVLESYRIFHGNVINIALIICFIKLCLLLSGDIEQTLKYIIIPPPYVFLSNPLNGLELKPGITKLLVGTRWSKWVSVKHQNPQQYVQCHQFCFSNSLYWGDIYTNWWLKCTSCVPLRRPRVPTNNLVIPGFNSNPFSGLDRNTYGGGIMMYFKDNINIVPRTHLQSITLSNSTLCCHWETRTSMFPMFVDK